jgi:ubiquinone/menaquinone biosynthesis C-methylase UbiE
MMKAPELVIPRDIPPEKLPSLLWNWHLGPKAKRYLSGRRFFAVTGALGSGCGRALDVGCGWGYNLFLLGMSGFDPIGIDIVQNDFYAAQRVAEANGRAVHLVGGDARELPFALRSFEAVTSVEVIEHIYDQDRRRAIEEIARVLVPGGVLSLSTPNFDSLIERGKRLLEKISPLKRLFPPMCYPVGDVAREDYHPYTYHRPIRRIELMELLQSAGFESVETRTIIFIWKNARDFIVPFMRLIEPLLERLPIIRDLGSTLLVTARKQR